MLDTVTTVSPPQLAFAAVAGVCIAAACGLRAFLPLLALALGSRFGAVHLSAQSAWMGSDVALWTLGIAAVVELAADKIPVVDHALDVLATFVRPAAAAIAGWATFGNVNPALAAIAALILGAGALGIHAAKAKLRLGSTALTLGHANPVLSAGEDLAAGVVSVMAILVPFVALVFIVIGATLFVRSRRRPPEDAPARPA